jgi:hypothetical protein
MKARVFNRPVKPALSQTEQKQLTQCLWMLDQVMRPARENPQALTEVVRIALAEVPYRSTSSQDDWALIIKLVCSKAGEYPLWAVVNGQAVRGIGTSLATS